MRALPIAILFVLVTPVTAQPPSKPPKATPQQKTQAQAAVDVRETYDDITKTLGFVPKFLMLFPDEGLPGAWDEMKDVQLNQSSALPAKTKELIGLAVSAQIPCRYCVYFHTVASGANGATENERKEAIAMSAITRHWSTVLNGMQIDPATFKAELAKIVQYLKNPQKKDEVKVTDAASAYRDMENTLGLVPTFMRRFPEEGIAAAWREFKALQLAPNTALPNKDKELIGLAVAAQIPCAYCVAFHTEAAKLNGASDAEIREAVAMSAIVRHWSTVLNGSMMDETQFRKDVDRVMKRGKEAAKPPTAATR